METRAWIAYSSTSHNQTGGTQEAMKRGQTINLGQQLARWRLGLLTDDRAIDESVRDTTLHDAGTTSLTPTIHAHLYSDAE
jgi:hypothetical protein